MDFCQALTKVKQLFFKTGNWFNCLIIFSRGKISSSFNDDEKIPKNDTFSIHHRSAGFCSNYWILCFGLFAMTNIRHFDMFVIPWAAGRGWLLEGISPYALSAIDIAHSAIDDSPFSAQLLTQPLFSQPFFSLIFYLPLSLLPYTLARSIWTVILALCVALIGYFGVKFSGWQINRLGMVCIAIFLIFSLPGAIAILEEKFLQLLSCCYYQYFVNSKQPGHTGRVFTCACYQ